MTTTNTKATKPAAKTAAKPTNAAKPVTHIENVTITNTSAANEHTRSAIEALARAAEANARALSDIANALKGAPATMGHAIYIAQETP